FSSRRRHTISDRDWSSDVCSSDLEVWGPPRDVDAAVAVLREAIGSGVNHIDTSDFYGPHVTNQIIKKALHPYPADVVIVTKVGRSEERRVGKEGRRRASGAGRRRT